MRPNPESLLSASRQAAWFLTLGLLTQVLGCSDAKEDAQVQSEAEQSVGQNLREVLPQGHPSRAFYRVASRGPTSGDVCERLGGVVISVDDFREQVAGGFARAHLRSNGREYIVVTYGEKHGAVLLVGQCCWPVDSTIQGR